MFELLISMVFLNPFVLFGLSATAIPIILHLLNLRKLRTVEFSTLAFLKELQKSTMRKIKIRQILLLILRTLVIAFVVLAFSRPALRGSITGSLGTHARTTIILILDDSFSMGVRDEHGELFKQAKETALKLAQLLKEGDEAFFLKISDFSSRGAATSSNGEAPIHDFTALKSAIQEARLSFKHRSIEDALRLSSKLLGKSKNLNKEIYLISDLQQTTIFSETMKQKGARELKENLKLFEPSVKLFVIPVGKKAADNVSIESIEIKNKIFEKEKPITVSVHVKNFGRTAIRNFLVSVFFDGERVMQKTIDVDAYAAASVEFSVIPKRTGFLTGYVELEDDLLDQDNRRYFTMFVPEKIQILFLGNSQSDILLMKLALLANQSASLTFSFHEMLSPKLLSTNLSNFDVVVLSNVKEFSKTEAQQLKAFIASGGGVLLFPGNVTDVAQYNNESFKTFGIGPIQGTAGSLSDKSSYLTFDKIDFEHPLFAGIFKDTPSQKSPFEKHALESPKIYFTLNYHPNANGQSIITLSNGSSFLSEYKMKYGKLLLCSVSASLDWSDFPLKGIFVPLLHRSMFYLASRNEDIKENLVGDELNIQVPIKFLRPYTTVPYKIKNPDGEEELIKSSTMSGTSSERTFITGNTNIPGIYVLSQENHILKAFAVNVDPQESDLRKIDRTRLEEFLRKLGLESSAASFVSSTDDVEMAVLQSRFGVELWRYCLMLALFFAAVEMIIAREPKQLAS